MSESTRKPAITVPARTAGCISSHDDNHLTLLQGLSPAVHGRCAAGGIEGCLATTSIPRRFLLRVGEIVAEPRRCLGCVPTAEGVVGEIDVSDHLEDPADARKHEVQRDFAQVVDERGLADLEDLACGL